MGGTGVWRGRTHAVWLWLGVCMPPDGLGAPARAGRPSAGGCGRGRGRAYQAALQQEEQRLHEEQQDVVRLLRDLGAVALVGLGALAAHAHLALGDVGAGRRERRGLGAGRRFLARRGRLAAVALRLGALDVRRRGLGRALELREEVRLLRHAVDVDEHAQQQVRRHPDVFGEVVPERQLDAVPVDLLRAWTSRCACVRVCGEGWEWVRVGERSEKTHDGLMGRCSRE